MAEFTTEPSGEERVASRHIPVEVRRQLRREVGFGCPVPGCGNPYLTYHHFDPPFAEGPHNDPERMIALCWMHHQQERAWTVDDFRQMKRADNRRSEVRGRFEWMKDDVLTIAGGSFFHQNGVEIAHSVAGKVLWYTRDEEGRMLLNLHMLHTREAVGTFMLDENDWTVYGTPSDMESPPRGSYLRVEFPGGDKVAINFAEHPDPSRLARIYDRTEAELRAAYSFPLVTAEITMEVASAGLRFGPRDTAIGTNILRNVTISSCGVGLML